MTHKRQVLRVIKRFDNPTFMEAEEMNRVYEGMWVLVKQDSKDAHTWDGGYVVAIASDTNENRDILHDALEKELDYVGFLTYGHIDRGESLEDGMKPVYPSLLIDD